METIKLNLVITQEDIDKGVRCDTAKCVIANAFNRMFDGIDVKVSSYFVHIKGEAFGLPSLAQGLIVQFDMEGPDRLSPCVIEFDIPKDIYDKIFLNMDASISMNKNNTKDQSLGAIAVCNSSHYDSGE